MSMLNYIAYLREYTTKTNNFLVIFLRDVLKYGRVYKKTDGWDKFWDSWKQWAYNLFFIGQSEWDNQTSTLQKLN
jgi:chemotaxis methyl-accepting protein methylase